MLAAYIFSLVVGGGLLALNLFGDFLDSDVDADAGIDLDGDADAISGGSEIAKLLSLRSLVYALFGFGGAGLVLHMIWAGAQPVLTALIAGGMGLGSGALVSTVFGYLKRTEAGEIQGERALVGLSGRIVMAIGDGETGAVRIRSGERQYQMRARADPPSGAVQALEAGRAIVVVDVKDGVALVTPIDNKLLED
ncbi:MAG: hypothetical protein F4Y07_00370 [Gemmatimonadetes bacterium]|nr:hypothetical protein [Gemmatimonadota bacterium]MYE14913.1 hypothetical protein [Gemmatimonadota bacterium]MYG21834.1 hypothetical protein [Gemmatimonadota bacterium]MYJ38462.1 hypothetical protein [Gemmatimonadota bacterium]